MTDTASSPLSGVGVLVTRPRAQAGELITAIESLGGHVTAFPVIEIVALDVSAVEKSAAELPDPDITLFISRNAVEYGIRYAAESSIGAIGPATAAAIEGAGRSVNIRLDAGSNSESLLEAPELQNVSGKQVRIIRGGDGRQLLANTLRGRGATVDYLSVYERKCPEPDPKLLADVEAAWRAGDIGVITVMSVQSLHNLARILPDWCKQQLESVLLVTPATRVIKEAQEHYSGITPVLAAGPQAADMVEALVANCRTDPE